MNPATSYHRSSEVVAANVGDQAFLLQITTWKYTELNESASRVWELLGDGNTLAGITQALCKEYDVDSEQCERDTAELLQELEEKHFLIQGQ